MGPLTRSGNRLLPLFTLLTLSISATFAQYWANVALIERVRRVKRGKSRLPLRVRGPIEPYFIRLTLDVENPRLRLVYTLHGVFLYGAPLVGAGHRIVGHLAQISLA